MQNNDKSEHLLDKAKEQEKMYNWLGAADFYEQASGLASEDFLKVAELQERIGYCFFRAALQAQANKQFNKRMKMAMQAYVKAVELFQKSSDKNRIAKVSNAEALVAYANSWLEVDASKKIALLDKWWTLKSKVLKAYERGGDQLAVARTCNDMMEGSADCRFWLGSNWKDSLKIKEELISLGERAIAILSELEDDYELARAYCWTSWCCIVYPNNLGGGKNVQKGLQYSKKAIKCSQKTGDAWLIGWSCSSASSGEMVEGCIKSGIKFLEQQINQGEIAKDNYLLGVGQFSLCMLSFVSALSHEDPDKNRQLYERNVQTAQEVVRHFKTINIRVWNAYYTAGIAFLGLASIELDIKTKYDILKKAVESGRKGVEQIKGWTHSAVPQILNCYSWTLYQLSEVERNTDEKRRLLEEALDNTKKSAKILQAYPYNKYFQAYNQNWMALAKADLSKITEDRQKKISLLNDAVSSIEIGLDIIKKHLEESPREWHYSRYGDFHYCFGGIYYQLYLLTKKKNLLSRATEVYKDAIALFSKVELITKVAESYWQKARIQDQIGEQLESANNYSSASKAYLKASEKLPKLKDFYLNHSLYMQAWSEIEQAKYNHAREDYHLARVNYEHAGKLHEQLDDWKYLSDNYLGWAKIEQAEELSRTEKPQLAIQSFQNAIKYFQTSENNIKSKIKEYTTIEEKDLLKRILTASNLRQRYCQARISIEEAKIFDRKGEYDLSSKNYNAAAQNIGSIIEELDSEDEQKELQLIQILCRAWEKMAKAEETTSSEVYLEAAAFFEQAKDLSRTKKASLWALGNSNFCRGLAAGVKYQTMLELEEHANAKGFMKSAATNYSQAGFKTASEYAKATQRLFDAYAFMNQAENELDQEKRAKQYQMAENLLQIAAGSFMKAKQPEKTTQVQGILDNVREEKALAVSLSQIMQAPTIASTTLSFAAPSSTSEASVGLESFEHANVQANLVTHVNQVKVGESFCLSVEFINAGRELALLTRVEDFIPSDFVVVKKPEIYRLEESCLNMKGKQLAPLKFVEVKLVLQPSKKGEYQFNPKVHYLDELGQNRSIQLKSVEIKVEEVVLSDRVSTGTQELDSLLLGGIPEGYCVALTGSPSDEREYLIKSFLEAGTKEKQITYYITTEADGLESLLEKSNFYLFLCNPKPKTQVPDLPNVFKLRSKTDLTNLSIALAKAYRNIEPSKKKRVCVEIVSDVLLDYEAKATRKWISELITDMGSKGFTMLAVVDPLMHASEELYAVLGLFDGEISLTQSGDPLECKKSILVKKLRNQDYIKNPICLT